MESDSSQEHGGESERNTGATQVLTCSVRLDAVRSVSNVPPTVQVFAAREVLPLEDAAIMAMVGLVRQRGVSEVMIPEGAQFRGIDNEPRH